MFNICNNANPLKRKQLALITELLCPHMEPRCRVSRGKTGEGETGKRDYRHRSQTGCVEKRQGAHGCLCDPAMQEHFLDHNSWEVFLTRLPARHA